jgi:hypothetical protein
MQIINRITNLKGLKKKIAKSEENFFKKKPLNQVSGKRRLGLAPGLVEMFRGVAETDEEAGYARIDFQREGSDGSSTSRAS